MRRPLFAVALCLLVPLAFGQAYKWTDGSGTVHYSETPPPQGTKYQKVTISGSVEPLSQPAQAPAPDTNAPPAPATASSEPMDDTPANRAKMCTSLKSNLDLLRGNGPVSMQQNGKDQVLDDASRKAQLDTAQAQYQQFCSK